MADEELHRDIILDHTQNPRAQGSLPRPTHQAQGSNPLCGDQVSFQLDVADGTVRQIRVQASGCAISLASASMLAERSEGLTLTELRRLAETFAGWMRDRSAEAGPEMGELAALAGVRSYPVRVRCALLPWETLLKAFPSDPGTGLCGCGNHDSEGAAS